MLWAIQLNLVSRLLNLVSCLNISFDDQDTEAQLPRLFNFPVSVIDEDGEPPDQLFKIVDGSI